MTLISEIHFGVFPMLTRQFFRRKLDAYGIVEILIALIVIGFLLKGTLGHFSNRFDDAKKYFGEIGAQKENIDLANRSQDLLMDIYNKEKSYTLLKDYSKSLITRENKEDRKEKLTKI